MFRTLFTLSLWLSICNPGFSHAEVPNTLSADELADGWILLFDGETTYGWKAASKADWRVTEGAIRVGQGEPGLWHTTAQFSDYELKVEYRAAEGLNSGIFLRTSPKPSGPTSGCYELNITRGVKSDFPTGSFVGRKRGAEVELRDDWHAYHIVANGGKFN